MPRTRDAAGQRTQTPRRRGQHTSQAPAADHVERRGEAHRVAPETTTDSLQLLFNQASRYPLLTREQEVELAQRIERGDLEAKERLINSNLRLVIKFARRYQGHGLPLQDLVQEAMLGLIRAAEKFDWRRGYKFSTYAVLWIKQAIQRGLDNTGRPVRIPAHVAQRERTVNRVEAELSAALNREPSDEELAKKAKLPLDEVKAIRDLTRVTTSLDAPVGEGDTSLGELRSESVASVEDEILERQQEDTVGAALATLPEEERRVIQLRFGTGGEPETSLREVARELGVTQERARKLEARALRRLADDDSLAAWRAAA
jgi:RNA polymerase primary sigma factor